MFGRFVQLTSQLWPESQNRGLTAMPLLVKAHSATLRRPRASGILSSAKETRIVADEHVTHQGVSGLFQRLQTPRSAEKRTPVTVLRLITFRGGLHGEMKRTPSRTRSFSPTHVTKLPTTSALSQPLFFKFHEHNRGDQPICRRHAQRPQSHEVQTNSNLHRPKHFRRATVTDDCISKGVGPMTTTL